MKKVLFAFTILFLFIINTKAQTYHPLIKPNKFWDVQFTDGSICGLSGGSRFFIQGDTIISGKNYNNVHGYSIVAINPGPYCPPFAVNESGTYNIPAFFIREDTIDKKVYVYKTYYAQEDLYYDYSLSVGDTLKSNYATTIFGTTYIVTNISLITLDNGQQRKKYSLNNGEYYIESIGGSKGLGQFLNITFGGSGIQECVSENGIALWYGPCFDILGINQSQNQTDFNISPNPFSQSTQITLNQTYHSIALAVYDIQGKQVAQQQYADCDKIQLSRNQLSNGLYFLKLTLDDKEVETGKMVISE
jgi:hypothetical protein